MKIPKLALWTALGALAASVAFAQPAPEDNPRTPQTPPNRARFEAARHKALLLKYDLNKDGKLDDTELAAIGRDVEQGKLDPRLAGPPPGRPPLGPGARGPRASRNRNPGTPHPDGFDTAAQPRMAERPPDASFFDGPPPPPRGGEFGPPPGPEDGDLPPPGAPGE